MNALESIGSLSSGNSAVTAVEKARNFLFKASISENDERVSLAAEGAHELLNEVETALEVFRRFVEDSDQGLLRSLESAREKYPVSGEAVDEILLDWKWLARKHGIHPSTLPSCHRALGNELSGSVEARSLLPQAIAEEKAALAEFEEACTGLSEQRQNVAASLSLAVSRRLPSLGMESAAFLVTVQNKTRSCSDFSVYMPGGAVGIDSAEFMLNNVGAGGENLRQGKIDAIASSGEKARILLAIECALPGAVGAACSSANAYSNDYYGSGIAPIAVIYDEIDSHVGGRAAVAMSQMLRDQSDSSQVIAITHSASVAASADTHIVIQKSKHVHGLVQGATPVQVGVVCDDERRKELARMASGDLAAEEAQIFADALIREGRRRVDA
jgi:DNA repair protein RecN (Recombination protein N)